MASAKTSKLKFGGKKNDPPIKSIGDKMGSDKFPWRGKTNLGGRKKNSVESIPLSGPYKPSGPKTGYPIFGPKEYKPSSKNVSDPVQIPMSGPYKVSGARIDGNIFEKYPGTMGNIFGKSSRKPRNKKINKRRRVQAKRPRLATIRRK